MAIYARRGRRRARQVLADVWMISWAAVWGWAAHALVHVVDALAAPARNAAGLATNLSGEMDQAQSRLHEVPAVGGVAAAPFGSLRDGLAQMAAFSSQQAVEVHRVAVVAGWLCFLVPVLTALAFWLPRRVRFIRESRAARRIVDADADLHLFALRALTHLPVADLARISDDPVGDWRRGDPVVVRALARRELARCGLDVVIGPARDAEAVGRE